MGKFKAVIEVEVRKEKEEYEIKKNELFGDMQKALSSLADSRGLRDYKLDLDDLETIEGRERIEDALEPLGIRHLKVTKILADI